MAVMQEQKLKSMLAEISISDLAIIDYLCLKFAPGLNVLTGETGAGKSIIMDALDMLMGGRADGTVIRSDADFARVEGTFQLSGPEREAAHEILKREDLLDDPHYVTLMREVRKEGRNAARINGRTVHLALLKELGEVLVDIHGQSEHLSLLNVRAHLGLLDRYAGVEAAHSAYHKTYQDLLGLRRRGGNKRDKRERADRSQREEVDSDEPSSDEAFFRLQTHDSQHLLEPEG